MDNNPALKDISFLVGNWSIELSNAAFLPNPSIKPHFSCTYKWIENCAAISVQQGSKEADFPQSANWIIGRDQDKDTYTVLYGDSRGVSRVYQMSYKDTTWKMWRDNPDFSQRFEGKVSEDRKTIDAKWEKSIDGGKTWQHDFDMTYTRT